MSLLRFEWYIKGREKLDVDFLLIIMNRSELTEWLDKLCDLSFFT